MSSAELLLLLLFIAAIVLCVGLLLAESRNWVAFRGAPGHRPGDLMSVARELRNAGVRHRIQNTVTVASESAIGAGVSTTLLVHKQDLSMARRAMRNRPVG